VNAAGEHADGRGITAVAGTGQPRGGLKPWEQDTLEAIRFGWGDAYLIGHDDERGYWAARRDRIGALITADDPDALWCEIVADYALRPVPREPPADGDPDGRALVLGTGPGALLTGSPDA
jgi:hypothetical protein